MLLDRGRGCTSFGQRQSSGAAKSGISFCFLLLDLSDYSLAVSSLSLTFVTDFSLPFFQGLHLLHWANLFHEEAQCLETAGLQKVELAVARSEAEGLYWLLQGALSNSSVSMAQPPAKKYQ